MSVKSVVRSTGDKVDSDDTKKVFVQGAYNQGKVIEYKELKTTDAHPGETVMYPTAAAGEDYVIIMADESISPVGLLEIDFGMVKDCSVDYTAGNEVPVLLYHWQPGALCRNVQCKDQVGNVADAGKLLCTSSGLAGALKILTETALVDTNGTGTGEAYAPGLTWGDMGTLHHNRTPMRQAHHQADASADYTVVAWILNI